MNPVIIERQPLIFCSNTQYTMSEIQQFMVLSMCTSNQHWYIPTLLLLRSTCVQTLTSAPAVLLKMSLLTFCFTLFYLLLDAHTQDKPHMDYAQASL